MISLQKFTPFSSKTFTITEIEFEEAFPEYSSELQIFGRTGDAIGEGLWFYAEVIKDE